MNNHDCANASVPFPDIAVTNAGPNDLAGFTDVPVKVIPNKCNRLIYIIIIPQKKVHVCMLLVNIY